MSVATRWVVLKSFVRYPEIKHMSIQRLSKSDTAKRILIVDDHPLVRRGLTELIAEEAGLRVCGDAEGTAEALALVKETHPDLVVVDLSLKSGHGLQLLEQIRAYDDRIKLLVSSMHDESVYAERALRAGASGYVNKQEAPTTVISAIREVLAGNVYLSSQMTNRMLQRVIDPNGKPSGDIVDGLSNRELEVFEMIGHGMSTSEIAERLHLSVKTIETYRENIKAKLDLRNASELTRRAVRWIIESE